MGLRSAEAQAGDLSLSQRLYDTGFCSVLRTGVRFFEILVNRPVGSRSEAPEISFGSGIAELC